MHVLCLDLEGVLVPEIWIGFAERTGIAELRVTTREEPDYDKLMRRRLAILEREGLGLPDIQAVPWFAYMAPKGTPNDLVQRMSREIAAVLKDPDTNKRLQTAYFDPVGSTPEGLAKFMNEELRRWKPVIERAGLKPD